MGNQLLDQYSLLHYASGVVAYFWGFEPLTFFLAHVGFELAENTSVGMRFINQHLTWWPGGKPRADNIVNMLGQFIGRSGVLVRLLYRLNREEKGLVQGGLAARVENYE